MMSLWMELTGANVAELGIWIFVRGTAFVAAAWAISRLGSKRGRPMRQVVWGALMVALLVVPLLSHALPGARVGAAVVPTEWWEASVAPATTAGFDIRPDARGARSPMAPTPIRVDLAEWEPPVARSPAGLGAWPRVALILWAVGAVLALGRLATRQVSLRMTARRARSWPDAAAHLSVDRLRRELGIRRRVRLLEISMLRVPACWGIVRPAVGLPPLAAEWDDRRLRAALLHELAHVRRWDYAAYFCGQVACALYWPNPAVWWAARRALLASESACDETVLRHGTERRDYASLLVAAAREARRGGLRPRPVMSMASGPDLRDRVRSVLRFRPSPGVSRAVVFRASAAAVALAAGIAALGVESDREARRARALRAVEEPLPEARAAAARTLGDLGESRVVSTLARLLNDESASVRGAAARAIAETGSGLAVRPLMRRLDDPDPRVRESVILALGRTRDRRAYYDLEELTGSTNRRLRLAATWAIGEIKCEPAIDRLSRLLRRSADPKTRLAAARGLRGAPRLLVQGVLRDALADPDPRVRTAAAESLRLVS